MTLDELTEVYAFTAKVLCALQEQINKQDFLIQVLVEKIDALQDQNMWNLAQGNIEQSPRDEFVVRLASGRLGLNIIEEDDDDATG